MKDGYTKPRLHYDAAGEDSATDRLFRADLALTRRIAAMVDLHYAGHQWEVRVSHRDGMAMVRIPLFMGATNWYTIPLWRLKSDPGLRLVVNACGEILERYRIPRSGFSRDDFLHARSLIPKNRLGTHGHVPA